MGAVDKLHLQTNQLKKELVLIKEDIKYICEHQKKKSIGSIGCIIDECEKYKEAVDKEMKSRMNELISEL